MLRPEVSARCSFTLLGSQEESAAEQTGTLGALEPVMAALAHHLEAVPAPFGYPGLTLHRLLTEMGTKVPIVPDGVSADGLGRALDSFVEAQVHGTVDLRRDVEALVVDAAFYGTEVGDTLAELGSTYEISLSWHPGFTLAADEFPEEFRGFRARGIAERVAKDGIVDALSLGAGQNDFVLNPEAWREFGSMSEILTSFRRVWHVLVLLGVPAESWGEVSKG